MLEKYGGDLENERSIDEGVVLNWNDSWASLSDLKKSHSYGLKKPYDAFIARRFAEAKSGGTPHKRKRATENQLADERDYWKTIRKPKKQRVAVARQFTYG